MMHLQDLISRHPVTPFIREGDMAVRAPWVNPERRLLDYLLIYVQEGRCRFTVDGTVHKLKAGDFCLVQPGSVNYLEGLTDTVTPFAHFDVFYHPHREKSFPTRPGQMDLSSYADLMQPRLNDIFGLEVPVRLQPRDPVKFRSNMLQMVRSWQDPGPLGQLKAQVRAFELILSIIEDHYEISEHTRDAAPSLDWIPSYLSYHLGEPLSIRRMAERAHLSPSRFSAVFKRRYGVPPHQYLMEMRIRHSCELLESTDLSQEEIGTYCGFSDIHHFSKTFKNKMKTTPGNWRKKAPPSE